jgi:hypothetical protein
MRKLFAFTLFSLLICNAFFLGDTVYATETTPPIYLDIQSIEGYSTVTLITNTDEVTANAVEVNIYIPKGFQLESEQDLLPEKYSLPIEETPSTLTYRTVALRGFSGVTKIARFTFRQEKVGNSKENISLLPGALLLRADGTGSNILGEQ